MELLWIKAFHIISVVTWFAGIFYLPRLFVYHADTTDEISNERFKVMERRLFYGIMTPSALIAIVLGFWLMSYGYTGIWLTAKIGLVFLVVLHHIWCYFALQNFKNDRNTKSAFYYRVMNELPVLLLIAIVILVVVKPF